MSPIEHLIESGLSLLLRFDEPALFLLFVLKGAIIGKALPTSLFLPGYLLVVDASTNRTVVAVVVASLGYVAGQLFIYRLSSAYGIDAVNSLPAVSVTDEGVTRAEQVFRRYSGAGIFITNLVPFVGTFIMIPAGMASYPIARTVLYALSSTLLNYALIVSIALGLFGFLGLS